MWLLKASEHRTAQDNLWLGTSTALVAGLVNVCSVMILFTFSSNVTGHVATFAEEVVKGQWHQVLVVLAWMLMFLLGALVANLFVTFIAPRSLHVGHGGPMVLQILLLCAVAHYGERHYEETLRETELLAAVLLFAMGLQNGTVARVSKSVVRTTHLTGLFTDLAIEISMMLRASLRADRELRFRFKLHTFILIGYLAGGLAGGYACTHLGFGAMYFGAALLAALLAHDLILLAQRSDAPARLGRSVASGRSSAERLR